jgi:hypothetical protein
VRLRVWWLVVQVSAIVAGIYAGVRLFGIVTR